MTREPDDARARAMPMKFVLAAPGGGAAYAAGVELATYLRRGMIGAVDIVLPEHSLTPINKKVRAISLTALRASRDDASRDTRPGRQWFVRRQQTVRNPKCQKCEYEVATFNPRPWNDDPYIRYNNNCYNYNLLTRIHDHRGGRVT